MGFAADSNLKAAPTDVVTDGTEPDVESEEPRRGRMLYEEVDPTDAQRLLIDSIIDGHRARTNAIDKQYRELRAQLRADFRVIVLETRELIKGVFTPEQAAEYQVRVDEWDARSAERENRDDRD